MGCGGSKGMDLEVRRCYACGAIVAIHLPATPLLLALKGRRGLLAQIELERLWILVDVRGRSRVARALCLCGGGRAKGQSQVRQ